MIKSILFNVCLFFVLGLGMCKFDVATIDKTYLLNENKKFSPMAIGYVHFHVTEYKLPEIDDLYDNKSIYNIDLNLNESGLIYQKSKENKKKTEQANGRTEGNVVTVEKGDYVRFIEKDDVFNLGTTLALDSGLNFKQLLEQMSADRNSVPIDRKITLVEFTEDGVDLIELYKLFTSHKVILDQYKAHKNIQKGQPILTFSRDPITFEDFLKDDSGIFNIVSGMFLTFVVNYVVKPIFYEKMEKADWENEKLAELFDELIDDLAFEAEFFEDYELVFNQTSFLTYINNFVVNGQASNLLIETVMMAVATNNDSMIVQLITDYIETDEEAQAKVRDTLVNIFYTLVTNVYRKVKKDIEIGLSIKIVSQVKPIFDKFNASVQSEPSLAKYKDAFTAIQPLSLAVFLTNFTPEIIELFFWSFQLNFDDFIMHYLYFSDLLPGFTDAFADDELMISQSKVISVWKYIHPDFFNDIKTKNFAVIKQCRRSLI